MVQQIGDFRAPDLVLAGKAVDVRAGAADPTALDDRNAASRLRQVPGRSLPPAPLPSTTSSYGSV
jgi:hypothetical protein